VRRAASALLAVGFGLLGATACVPTARTGGAYSAKAVTAAEAVHDSVGSILLVLDAVERGHTTAPYASVATSDAEDAASTAASTFLSIQPPDRRAERLRSELSDLLSQAQDALGDARIAGRRGDEPALLATGHSLATADRRLQAFAEANG
jgi:hypothetical protein